MKNAILSILIFFLLATNCNAQNINLTFNIKNASGKNIYLIEYTDYITEMETIIFSSAIPKNGIVEYKIDANDTKIYKIQIELAEKHIYLQPNSSYTIDIIFPEIDANTNPFQNIQYLYADIVSSNQNDINKLITDFNAEYDNFLFEKLFNTSPKKILTEHNKFETQYLKKIEKSNDTFFKPYVKYSFGLTEVSLIDKIDKIFIDKYFTNKDVEYNLYEYFGLLTEVCKFTDYILKDSTSNNLQLKEVTYLYFLMRDFYGDYEKEEVLKLMQNFISKAKYSETKEIGNNILTYLTRFRRGTLLPNLDLESEDGEEYSIFQTGKNVYLFFFNSDIDICAEIIEELGKMNLESEGVTPLLISLDFTKPKIKSEKIPILIPKDVVKIHNQLNIRNYPFAIIVDKNGKIIRYNAPLTPSQLEEFLSNEL